MLKCGIPWHPFDGCNHLLHNSANGVNKHSLVVDSKQCKVAARLIVPAMQQAGYAAAAAAAAAARDEVLSSMSLTNTECSMHTASDLSQQQSDASS
jgi:hypothetical protein